MSNQQETVERCREAGAKMGGRQWNQQIGYTTDEQLARACGQQGARVTFIRGQSPLSPRVDGWEIVVPPDPEVIA